MIDKQIDGKDSTVFAKRRPLLFSILLILLIFGIVIISDHIFQNISSIHGLYFKKSIRELFLAVVLSLIVTKLKWWKEIGFRRAKNPKILLIFFPCLIPFAVVLVGMFTGGIKIISISTTISIGIFVLLVGFVEEVAFRGLMLNALKPRGKWIAVLTTAGLFGLVHALNLLNGASLSSTIIQIFYASVFGFGFAAMALRGKRLWPLIIAHALTDFFGDMPKAGTSSAGEIIPVLFIIEFILLVGYGAYLMQKDDSFFKPEESQLASF
jgi:membrane protease YdiL (CAAX protease family)